MKRLGTDWLDLYQVHSFDPAAPLEETMRALEDVVRAGKVRYLGCSNYAAWQIAEANGIAARLGWTRFESLQAYYTIAGRDLERELAPLLTDEQMGLMVWSPLAGGLLGGKFTRGTDGKQTSPDGARRSSFDFPPVNKERAFDCVDAMKKVGDAHGVSVARVALAWLLAKNEEQLTDNIAATTLKLTEADVAALDEVSKLPVEYPGWMLEFSQRDRFPADFG